MRAVVQRVSQAQVTVDGRIVGAIGFGLMVLLGIHRLDGQKDLDWMVDKILHLRIFEDEAGLMNRSLLEVGGQLLVVSQFTLCGDCRTGRRPSWNDAAQPDTARQWYEQFLETCRQRGIPTQEGMFGAMMDVALTNAGPVTILLDSHKLF